jgi:hypothetical protein
VRIQVWFVPGLAYSPARPRLRTRWFEKCRIGLPGYDLTLVVEIYDQQIKKHCKNSEFIL